MFQWVAGEVAENRPQYSPRMKPLEEKGRVQRTDERRDGGIVWVALSV